LPRNSSRVDVLEWYIKIANEMNLSCIGWHYSIPQGGWLAMDLSLSIPVCATCGPCTLTDWKLKLTRARRNGWILCRRGVYKSSCEQLFEWWWQCGISHPLTAEKEDKDKSSISGTQINFHLIFHQQQQQGDSVFYILHQASTRIWKM
jgi:hypothetical protein